MKVKELIKELKKHDPNKEVMIEQMEDCDYQYLDVHSVKERIVVDMDSTEDEEIEVVSIEYR